MKVGYRVLKCFIKYYIRNDICDCCSVYSCSVHGNKKRKPEQIFKYGSREFGITNITLERFEELKEEMGWFEVKDKIKE